MRKQFLVLDGKVSLAFVTKGKKFTACTAFRDITSSVRKQLLHHHLASIVMAYTVVSFPGCQLLQDSGWPGFSGSVSHYGCHNHGCWYRSYIIPRARLDDPDIPYLRLSPSIGNCVRFRWPHTNCRNSLSTLYGQKLTLRFKGHLCFEQAQPDI